MSSMMAAEPEPWNKVNVPFPGAVSSVRITPITDATDENVDQLLLENDKVLMLLRSQILQTEVRVLYELLYVLHYSNRGNRTFRALKQVEQCINRLKEMKLDAALQDLTDLCPTKFQRELSMHSKGIECDVPSQPMLEWLCLKVLGAARLMSCTMTHCGRAFTLSKQTLKWEEFIILNVVITAMLSRLWVFFRGILANLAPLYTQILRLLGEVSQARPMPYLKDYSLPEDMVQFLGPSEDVTASLMMAEPLPSGSAVRDPKATRRPSSMTENLKSFEEHDIGVPVKRVGNIIDGEALCNLFKDFTEDDAAAAAVGQKEMFHKQVNVATTFTKLSAHLENMVPWCRSHHLRRETRLLSFVHLRCRKMKHLEAAGFNVQRKLRRFKREACWASSLTGSVPASFRSSVSALRRRAHHRTRFLCLRERFNHRTARVLHPERNPYDSHSKRTELPVFQKPAMRTQVMDQDVPAESGENASKITPLASLSVSSNDEIDDIFASVGF